ncbi:MAG TPA: amino-acid N-acetyltransferase [Verrucomicrobiota bacterium]|jgi:amino-acid N-acetyltransferase|nr:amino-acid N-acetyltransferase [Verrucomicrobiota bacterium]
MKPTDLRGILQYIPKFRDRIFVVSVDGAIVSDENFSNLLLDFAVLRSLNIRVALVHGAASQIASMALERGIEPSDLDGTEPVDASTLELALTAANRLTHEILEGFAANGLRGVSTNALTAHPRGIIDGIDHQFAGKVERIDLGHLESLLTQGSIPVIPPLGFDGEGNTYRVNSDDLAREVAVRLRATKLIYVTTRDGLIRNGEVIRQIPNGELDQILEHQPASFEPEQLAKARNSATACQAGISRVHLINGSVHEGLLAEVFSNTGIGTLVYANEYRQIRPAKKSDLGNILALTKNAIESAELMDRSLTDLEASVGEYHLFEIDGNPVGCFSLTVFPEVNAAELGSVCVSAAHENQGIGRKLVEYAEKLGRDHGLARLFLLSTQTFKWFQSKAGFTEGTLDDLPEARRVAADESGRGSKVLLKLLE